MQVLTTNVRIANAGVGYVGLPLAVEFAKLYPTLGFDINAHRIAERMEGVDHTLETDTEELAAAVNLSYTTDAAELGAADQHARGKPDHVLHDLKYVLDTADSDIRL